MPKRTLVEVVEFAIIIEEKLPMKWKNMARKHQNVSHSDEFDDFDNENECRNPNLAKCGGEAQHLEKLGIWSPLGLPNVHSSTAGPKTPRIGVFLVSFERS